MTFANLRSVSHENHVADLWSSRPHDMATTQMLMCNSPATSPNEKLPLTPRDESRKKRGCNSCAIAYPTCSVIACMGHHTHAPLHMSGRGNSVRTSMNRASATSSREHSARVERNIVANSLTCDGAEWLDVGYNSADVCGCIMPISRARAHHEHPRKQTARM